MPGEWFRAGEISISASFLISWRSLLHLAHDPILIIQSTPNPFPHLTNAAAENELAQAKGS